MTLPLGAESARESPNTADWLAGAPGDEGSEVKSQII